MTGRVIAGRYELTTVVGRGGMGEVWTAHDRRLDRRVAVKLLRSDRMAGPGEPDELRRRFLRESRITAQVDHPGLVTVHDTGTDGDDLYLVMQYVEGADLADHLAEHGPYPWRWAVAVAAQLCPVLAAVHAVPVVHRDLKPRNVMVRPDGSVLVLDLGIAAVLDSDTTRLTLTGSPIGSPAYMAPEQAMGGPVGPRADLYSLGVILHELLGGTVPFAGTSALGVLHRHLHEPPVPLRRVRPEVPDSLEALVLRLLAKDPRHRPADAREVRQQLTGLLPAAEPGSGGAPDRPMDPTRPFRRPCAPWPDHGPSSAGPGAATVTLRPVAGPGAPGDRSRDVGVAVDAAKRLLDEGRITQAVGVLGDALSTAAEVHGAGSRVVGMLRKQYAATLMECGQFGLALPELRLLAAERSTEAGPADPRALRFRYEAALCLEHLGDPAAALAEYRDLLPHLDRPAADPDLALEIRHRTGQLLLASGDFPAARGLLTNVLHTLRTTHGPHHPLVAATRRTLDWLNEAPG